jgi:hypothetical protein
MQQEERHLHIIVMAQDEVGQLKVVLDGKLIELNVDRDHDGTGHLYGKFAPEVSREEIAAMIEAQTSRSKEQEQEDAAEQPPRNPPDEDDEDA